MNATDDKLQPAPSATQVVERDLLATLEPLGLRGRIWIAGLLVIAAIGLTAWITQLVFGLRVTSMGNYVSWGVYMANFVFFIGISHAGTLISAILRVTNADWRRPITRMAEAITVFALMVGAPMVLIDMGRPDRVLNVVTHGRLQSPILWDILSISTYLTGSLLYLYVAMIPDMPILARRARERGRAAWLVRLYDVMSLGYRDTAAHRRRLGLALGAMAVIIIPVAVSVHTVVSWVFGMTLRPGWHSTIFGPYFVIGAIFSGTAAIITAMVVFRRAYHLERYLLPEHFRSLGKLLLALSLLYAYFTLSEYLTAWYGGVEADARLLELLAGRTLYGASFWLWVAFGLLIPIALLLFPARRSITAIVTASVLINVGMWIKRYLIVVPTLQTPFIPAEAANITPHYFPSPIEWMITAGAFAVFLLLFTLFSRIFPILSIWETAEQPSASPVSAVEAPVGTTARRLGTSALSIMLLAGGLAAGALAIPARVAHAQPPPLIELARTAESGDEMIVATVTVDGRPVPDAKVAFFVKRSFGFLALGEDVTLEDGTAAVEFPHGLPGGSRGELQVRAAVVSPESTADTVVAEATLAGGVVPAHVANAPLPRALWAPRAPLGLVGGLAFLLLCVWLTYAFVVAQLFRIKNLTKDGGYDAP